MPITLYNVVRFALALRDTVNADAVLSCEYEDTMDCIIDVLNEDALTMDSFLACCSDLDRISSIISRAKITG